MSSPGQFAHTYTNSSPKKISVGSKGRPKKGARKRGEMRGKGVKEDSLNIDDYFIHLGRPRKRRHIVHVSKSLWNPFSTRFSSAQATRGAQESAGVRRFAGHPGMAPCSAP